MLLYLFCKDGKRLKKKPKAGDLVFFDNTWDKNRDGKINDPLTHAGIVVKVDSDSTVHFIHHTTHHGIIEDVLNLKNPSKRTDENGNESRVLTVPFNGDVYTGLFEYIVKALSWFHWGAYIENNSSVLTIALTKHGEEMSEPHQFSRNSKNTIDETLGKDTVKYYGMQAVDNEQITVWKFEVFNGLVVSNSEDEGFHKSTCIGAISGPPKLVDQFRELFGD